MILISSYVGDIYQKALLFQVVLIIYFILLLNLKPYLSKILNKNEIFGNIIIFLILWLKLINYSVSREDKYIEIIILIFEYIFHLILIAYCVKNILELKLYELVVVQNKALFLKKFLTPLKGNLLSKKLFIINKFRKPDRE